MAKQTNYGPLYMPWEKGHHEEIFVFMVAGLAGAIIGTTIVTHYRKSRMGRSSHGRG